MTTNETKPHPCTGYNAALTDYTIKLETIANQDHTPFKQILEEATTIYASELHKRLQHIIFKYEKSIETITKDIQACHDDWNDNTRAGFD